MFLLPALLSKNFIAMKYEKLIFIYPFSIGSFLNAKVGLEATLEDGDDYLDCFHKLRKDVKEMADIEVGKIYDAPPMSRFEHDEFGQWPKPNDRYEETLPETDNRNQEKRIGVIADDILSCNDLEVLKTYRFIKDSEQKLKEAYEKRYNQLSNQTV